MEGQKTTGYAVGRPRSAADCSAPTDRPRAVMPGGKIRNAHPGFLVWLLDGRVRSGALIGVEIFRSCARKQSHGTRGEGVACHQLYRETGARMYWD